MYGRRTSTSLHAEWTRRRHLTFCTKAFLIYIFTSIVVVLRYLGHCVLLVTTRHNCSNNFFNGRQSRYNKQTQLGWRGESNGNNNTTQMWVFTCGLSGGSSRDA